MYVMRDKIDKSILGYSTAPHPGFEYIDDDHQELIDWKAADSIQKEIIAARGYSTADMENYAKLFVKELANHFVNDINMPQNLKDTAQDVIDNVI